MRLLLTLQVKLNLAQGYSEGSIRSQDGLLIATESKKKSADKKVLRVSILKTYYDSS